ncbi:hypothetical protein, conserved [Eimeria acervulina]|uniref:Transmembrane protein n=1 Tax=Eimeria acervulina TaxID=5801 RepID=U6GZ80_EIMAC|nr:hypothetical protein, conserved [Eimeria acervulina]CDI83844.1 hypothetical protein, conserved [Eimeria acervulina]
MSSSFSIEISREDVPRSGASRSSRSSNRRSSRSRFRSSSNSSRSHDFDVAPSESSYCEPFPASQSGESKVSFWRARAASSSSSRSGAVASGLLGAPISAQRSVDASGSSIGPPFSSQQQQKQQQQLRLQPDEGAYGEVDSASGVFGGASAAASYPHQQQEEQHQQDGAVGWGAVSLSAPAGEGSLGGRPAASRGSNASSHSHGVACSSSNALGLRAFEGASAGGGFAAAPKQSSRGPRGSSGRSCSGALKERRESRAALRAMSVGEEEVVLENSKLWLARGSVLWRFFLCALALRVGCWLALLVVVLTTLGRMGRAVSCIDMGACVGGGGLLAFPVLLRAAPSFAAGLVAYESITGLLVAGLVLVLLPMAGNCYYTCQALLKGTRKAFLEEVRMTTCCTAWVGACVGVFIPVLFFTQQFCDRDRLDINAVYRADNAAVGAASANMCKQLGLSRACVVVAALCACSTGMLVFQRYTRLWAALLAVGGIKFMLAGFLLCLTVMFGGQSNQMMLETMDKAPEVNGAEGLQQPMVVQLGLFFAALKWGGYILAASNLATGAFTVWLSYLRSHLLSFMNMLITFVFFFTNAVSFFAMTFENATLQVVCNYSAFPMPQTDRAAAEAALFCVFRPQFIFVWALVALLSCAHFVEFCLCAALFHGELKKSSSHQQYSNDENNCSSSSSSDAVIPSAHSIDSLPPKWGTVMTTARQ